MERIDFKQHNNGFLKVFIAKETVDDYTEKTKSLTYYNPIVIPAIISELTSEQLFWKSGGVRADRSFQVLIDKKFRETLRLSNKININGVDCYGYRNKTTKLKMKEMDTYIELLTWGK